MADLNTLLRWAVENSTKPDAEGSAAATEGVPVGDGLTLKYKPAVPGAAPSPGVAALHPSDAQYPLAELPPAEIGNPAAQTAPTVPKSELNSEIIDIIMGKSDSVAMREKMAIATNEDAELEERVDALDEFEMLIELIDNANNMPVLKLWTPLLDLLDNKHAEIVRHALWIMGTACQNNLKGQAALFLNDALPKILDLLEPANPAPTRAKAVYALSAAVKHWPLAAEVLSENSNRGFKALAAGVADADRVIRRKMAFLLGTLVSQARDRFDTAEMPGEVRALLEEHSKKAGGQHEDLIAALGRTGVFAAAVSALVAAAASTDADDVEYEENLLRALARAAAAGGLTAEEKEKVKAVWNQWGAAGQQERGFEGQDSKDVEAALA